MTILVIPTLDPVTGLLPPGTHLATWRELVVAFGGGNFKRKQLVEGLEAVRDRLYEAGVTTMWIDGSFTTNKLRPGDVDVVYVPPSNADIAAHDILDPRRRGYYKSLYRIDLWRFPSPQPAGPLRTVTIKQYFEVTRDGTPKGIVELIREKP